MLLAGGWSQLVHKVVFWRGAKVLVEEPWRYGLETAKTHARDHLVAYEATHVEVIEKDTRAVTFTYAGEPEGQ
jgi:hypothetical protein